ncbi:hypothetical protein DdX_21371 [Ditylenchus destructor]|uniref:F-box domain-containing protein n=1 Tax=Ditylenchus destructor TaxID=166010 RepID=A0AAD4MJR2_9BILA|nr:hypothetical protein DdX_21371 [Ditylenchus destructor]
MRRSARLAEKQANPEREVQREPKAKKSRPKDKSNQKIPNIAAMDNGTMVEAFKFLNYCQLAKSSLVSKRFWNLIQTHRKSLALLYVDYIFTESYVAYQDPALIKIVNNDISLGEYNEWIARNGYSKQVPFEGRIAGNKIAGRGRRSRTNYARDIYEFSAAICQNPNSRHVSTTVFYARNELKDENWPVFQHFIRLLMDPFIYIRYLSLEPQKDVLSLLAGAMNPDRDRLQCKRLNIRFNDDTQKFVVWVKNHARCNEIVIEGSFYSNYDKELFDFFMTASPCTSAINVIYYDFSKVIVDLVQKFMGLKSRDEYQMVESIRGNVKDQRVVEELKRNYSQFIAEEEQYEERYVTLAECLKKRAKKPPPVLEQAEPEQSMDQPPLQLNMPIYPTLFRHILTSFDRRELCQLRNVNRRHYTVIERKFRSTPPYLVYEKQRLNESGWKWSPVYGITFQYDEMPSEMRDQLPVSKFVRFKLSKLQVYNPSETNFDVLSISHVWENQKLTLSCASNFVWNEEWAHMAAKAKYLEVNAIGIFHYLRQLTSGNCVRLSLTDMSDTLDTVELPWDHILEFLLQPNPEDTKSIQINAINPFNSHQVEILQFLEQVKQEFLESSDSVHFTFAWESFSVDNSLTYDRLVIDGFIVQNQRTKQRLRFRLTDQEFRLAVDE